MKETKKGVDRRKFLKGTAFGLGCLSLGGLKEALALERASGKPLLTDKSLNSFIQNAYTNKNKAVYTNLAREARANIKTFLPKYFTLTPAQADAIKNLSFQNISELNKGIDLVINKRTLLATKFVGEPKPGVKASAKIDFHSTHTTDPGGKQTDEVGGSVEVTY